MVNDIGYEGGYISKLSIIDGKLMTKTPTEEHLSHLVSTEKITFISLDSGRINPFVFSKDSVSKISGCLETGKFQFDKVK
jgi:hypothetical protein